MAVSMFQDGGVTYGCEADVFGAMSLMLPSYLFDKPGFMNDPVPETVENLLLAALRLWNQARWVQWSPGALPAALHSESDIGVALQVIWKESAR